MSARETILLATLSAEPAAFEREVDRALWPCAWTDSGTHARIRERVLAYARALGEARLQVPVPRPGGMTESEAQAFTERVAAAYLAGAVSACAAFEIRKTLGPSAATPL